MEKADVFILGAGPVGLLLGIKLSQNYKVILAEKRASFTREQIIILDHVLFHDLPT